MRTDRNIKSKKVEISSPKPILEQVHSSDSLVAPSRFARLETLMAAFKKLPKDIEHACHQATIGLPYYVPGILLIGMSSSLVFAPELFLAFCSGLILYLGFVAIYFGRRFRELRAKFADVIKQFEARIYIRGQAPGWSEQEGADEHGRDKKTVLH